MNRIESRIDIAASPAAVWSILTDFPRYPEWNPFIIAIEGEVEIGRTLRVVIRPPARAASVFRPTVIAATAQKEFRWIGRLFVPGLFDGVHSFTLEALPDGSTRFTQAETFAGILVPMLAAMIGDAAKGFARMNEALKSRAERR